MMSAVSVGNTDMYSSERGATDGEVRGHSLSGSGELDLSGPSVSLSQISCRKSLIAKHTSGLVLEMTTVHTVLQSRLICSPEGLHMFPCSPSPHASCSAKGTTSHHRCYASICHPHKGPGITLPQPPAHSDFQLLPAGSASDYTRTHLGSPSRLPPLSQTVRL